MSTDIEARARLLKILDDARTFRELCEAVTAEHGANADVLFGLALRFLTAGEPGVLDGQLQERFAQVLSRFVESTRALELAGILEAGDESARISPAAATNVDGHERAGFHDGMRYQFVQTYGEISRDKDGPRALVPPRDPGDWELHSWFVDPQSGQGNFMIVVWKRELAQQERSDSW